MAEIIPLRPTNLIALTKEQAEAIIRQRAEVSVNVIYDDHVIEQMYARDITREDIDVVLKTGSADQISRADGGDWKVLVTKRIFGVRVGVVTIILSEEGLYLITVEEVT